MTITDLTNSITWSIGVAQWFTHLFGLTDKIKSTNQYWPIGHACLLSFQHLFLHRILQQEINPHIYIKRKPYASMHILSHDNAYHDFVEEV